MLAEEKDRRQKALELFIFDISKELLDSENVRAQLLKLLDIYRGGFRHRYASFFQIISSISERGGDLEILSNNLEEMNNYVENDFISGRKEFEDLRDPLVKICDHLNLEIGRWGYYSKNESRIEDIQLKTGVLKDDIEKAEKQLKRATKQASSLQSNLIAVLSIFAAIVTTFSGSFSFLGSVMTSINGAKKYEMVVLTAIICGMVIFNTIFLMMYLVSKLTDVNIFVEYSEKHEQKSGVKDKNKSWLTKVRMDLPYVFYFNLLCIIGIIIDCIVWYLDVKGWLFI